MLHEFGVGVDLAAADLGTARDAQRHHAPIGLAGRAGEDLELHLAHHVGQLGQLELDPQVGLVRPVQPHRIGVLHHRKGGQLHADGVLEGAADHALKHRPDLFLLQERGLDVDLRELRLTIGAQVFVAEALGDLVVAVEAGHHQQLLEQLRALRQREELAVVHAAGHQVVARALGCAAGQHRRFDVDEAVGIEELAHLHGHAVAQHQVALHVGAAQVEHAVRQTRRFREVLVVDLEWRRDAGVQHLELVAQHFDLAAGEVGVLGAGRARAHQAHYLQAELVAHVLSRGEHVGPVGIADHLHQAFAVTQVDEDHAAVIATTMGPAHQGDRLAHQRFADQAAVGASHASCSANVLCGLPAEPCCRQPGAGVMARPTALRPAGLTAGCGGWRPSRRSHHAHGNDVLQGLVHAHAPAAPRRCAASSERSPRSGWAWWAHRR